MNNWRVQKIIMHPDKQKESTILREQNQRETAVTPKTLDTNGEQISPR